LGIWDKCFALSADLPFLSISLKICQTSLKTDRKLRFWAVYKRFPLFLSVISVLFSGHHGIFDKIRDEASRYDHQDFTSYFNGKLLIIFL
jgi:hypothetical protein